MQKGRVYVIINSVFFLSIILCEFSHISNSGIGVFMYSMIHTAALEGIHTIPVLVEVDVSAGLPMFEMVGYLSSEVREAKERVRTALHNCGISLPAKRITMNLAPANIKKIGTAFDLPIAVALMCSLGIVETERCKDIVFVGELSLNGRILPVNGILPIVSDGVKDKKYRFVVPKQNQHEANLVKEALIYTFDDLSELIRFLNNEENADNWKVPKPTSEELNDNKIYHVDFSDVNGQQLLKRASEVAAAGMHNMLMIGPPGAGKTMISERIPTILPPLLEEEKLELSKIYSICGLLDNKNALIRDRPFRNPHHTISKAGLVGGGFHPNPGEISLAHQGVLFLDELTEFHRDTIEVLRQPLEEKKISLARAGGQIVYPANFLLLAAMNPCKCGYYPDMQKCRCTESEQKRYFGKISQPLIDRIDICVEASPLSYAELRGNGNNESSAEIRARVIACHKRQRVRFANEDFWYNNQIPASKLETYCFLEAKEAAYMENMFEKMELTGRTYHKILRVARTIADLDEEEGIRLHHLREAICYRSINEKFWGGME